MISRIGSFTVFHSTAAELRFLKELDLTGVYRRVASFLDYRGEKKVSIRLVRSVAEFESFYGAPHKPWMRAFSNSEGIVAFSPTVLEQLTTQKLATMHGSFVHELMHVLYRRMGLYQDQLLTEGIASCIQHGMRPPFAKVEVDLATTDLTQLPKNGEIYRIGHSIVCAAIKQSGRPALLRFLSDARGMTPAEATKLFRQRFARPRHREKA